MSVSMTLDAVWSRQKTVTRRHVDTWKNLKTGDRLTLIEKGMGLPKGAKQVVVDEVEIIDVRVELLDDIHMDPEETRREGLAHMSPAEFVSFWLAGHGYKATDNPRDVECRRIEWRYLDEDDLDECLRCGSSVAWVECGSCAEVGDLSPVDGSGAADCPGCQGCGSVPICLSSESWCEAHPLPGREAVER